MALTSLFRRRRGFGTRGLELLVLSGLAVSSLVGCGGDDGKEQAQAPGTSTVVENVEMDGFLLLVANNRLVLLDTESGKISAETLPVSGAPNPSTHFAVSPNGRQIASVDGNGKLFIADVTFEGGVPGLKTVREMAGDYERPRYTPDGLRIVTLNGAVDPATGDAWKCSSESVPRFPALPVPGGHRYVCQESQQLKDDGDVLASDVSVTALSADGQFIGEGVHVPSGTKREIQGQPTNGPFVLAAEMPLADGTFAALYASASGEAVAESPGGFVTLYSRFPIDQEQLDGRTFDLKASFESGDWADAEGEIWPLRDAGFPLLTEGDGRRTGPYGVSQDGRFALFGSSAWIIEGDPLTNVLYEVEIESAFSLVNREGRNVQSYRTSSFGDVALLWSHRATDVEGAVQFQPELFQDASVIDFGDGNMLVPITASGVAQSGWGGFFDGKPYLAQGTGRMSRDGRWFFVAGDAVSPTDLRLCLARVGSTSLQCLSTSIGGEPVGIVGYGLKSNHAEEAPEILATSRSAAWPGSSVSVFGVRFGASGTLRIGDREVAEADIVEWADDRIVFTAAQDLPESGQIVVETARGKGGVGRQFWLHQSRLLETPFDGIHVGTIPLGQGLNVVDLGQYEVEDTTPLTPEILFSSATRFDTGEYVVFSTGAPEPTMQEFTLSSGGYSHEIYFQLENRLADDTTWQPIVRSLSVDEAMQFPSFRTIAGDVVEYAMGSHPLVGERIELAGFANRIPGTVAAAYGAPDYFREGEDGKSAWVINKVDNVSKGFNLVLGWDGQAQWGSPRFADMPRAALLPFVQGVEAAGQVLVLTGSDLQGTGKAGFQLSSDGGLTFGPMTLVDEALGNVSSSLVEPVRVLAKAGTFFLVLESLGGSDVAGVHAISTAGVLTKGVAEVPSGAQLPSAIAPSKANLNHVSAGGKLLLHFPVSHTLVATDFDAAGDAPKAWTQVPSAAAAGKVRSIWQDPSTAIIYAVQDDGAVLSCPGDAFDDPAAWEEVDLGIELALPISVRPLAVSRLEDGRWFVLANMEQAENPGQPSLLGDANFLIGPKP